MGKKHPTYLFPQASIYEYEGFMLLFQNANVSVLQDATQVTSVVWQSINNLITSSVARLPMFVAGMLVALIFYLAARIVKYIFLVTTERARLNARLRLLFSRLIVVAIVVLGFFTALTVMIPSFGFGDLVAGAGFTTFMIGFATKDILNNLLSGVLILWQEPFRLGDQIFIGKIEGTVEHIGVRATSLRKDDGELVIIPNGDMYSGTLVIRGAGEKRRLTIAPKIGYDTDIERTKAVIRAALLDAEGVAEIPAPTIDVTELASDGIVIRTNFWVDTNQVRAADVYDNAAVAMTKALHRSGIELFPPSSLVVRENGDDGVGNARDESRRDLHSAALD
jgi:small conductance mechanosensitive channel